MALLKFHTEKRHKPTLEERREALAFGKIGEQMAAKYLTDKGYVIPEVRVSGSGLIFSPRLAASFGQSERACRRQ